MRNKYKKLIKIASKSLILALIFVFLVSAQVIASNSSTFNQTINAGTQSVDIVDGSGNAVASPSITMGAANFSFDTQIATGQFGTATQKVRATNATSDDTWTVNIAASNTTDSWTAGGSHYDFNDANGSGYTDGADTDSYSGQMTVNPSTGSVAGVSGCATTNVSAGASDSFVEGSVDSIDIMSGAAGSPTFCRWDFTGAVGNISQKIPASQASGAYSITMSVTVL